MLLSPSSIPRYLDFTMDELSRYRPIGETQSGISKLKAAAIQSHLVLLLLGGGSGSDRDARVVQGGRKKRRIYNATLQG
jgi:hypothetical protein